MAINKNKVSKNAEYTVSYSGMRGVDFSNLDGKTKRYRFAYLENMYKDYSGNGAGITESIPGFRKLVGLGGKIHSIYTYKNDTGELYYVIHAGDSLYTVADSMKENSTTLPPVATLKDSKSRGFTFNGNLYILDGENIIEVKKNSTVSTVTDPDSDAPYIPTTYYNGEEYEQRNLLTDKFCEKYLITSAGDLTTSTDGLTYEIISEDDATVCVSGIKSSTNGVIYIPSYTKISGVSYKVTEVSDYAFYSNNRITAVILSDTVKKIGKYAFGNCLQLARFTCRSAIETIEDEAFYGCAALTRIHLGYSLREIGTNVFTGCTALGVITYEGSQSEFKKIESATALDQIPVIYDSANKALLIDIPIFSPAASITEVYAEGSSIPFATKIKNSLHTAITLSVNDRSILDGMEISIFGVADSNKFTANSAGINFIAESEASISGKDAIAGCTVCECFDGRVFLSGNPKLPNTVFYSARDNTGRNNPLYFGVLNYFNDGTGNYCVKSLLAAGDSLAVFKSGDDGGGSIYYHVPKETGIDILPKVYPVSYIHSGIGAIGESVSFFDDPLFLSSLGLTALDKKMINLERSIAVRSNNVNAKLLGEDLENITMTKWCGYLVLQAKDRFYLADSRDIFTNDQGKSEYEWYYLSGIGSYSQSRKVFRYAEHAKDGSAIHPTKVNQEVEGTVYLAMDENNQAVYYTVENGTRYAAYTDGELRGGIFSPASCVFATEDGLLFFGTECGDLCLFNTDKRGVAPTFIKDQADFNEEEYRNFYGNEIHPYFYNFDSHAPRYALKTVTDNGGIPNYTKNTVKNSLVVKVRCIGTGAVNCEVGTESGGYKEIAELPDSALNFAEFDFENLSFANPEYATLALREREKDWLEKDIALYSEKYSSPFGIYSIIYRFTVKGKIKN